MRKYGIGVLFLAGLLASNVLAQAPEDYLDIGIVRVKPEKRTEFDAVSKKIADLNRKNKGDTWLAYEVLYGEQSTVYFVSKRQSFGAVEEGYNAFLGSMTKALGPAGMAKLLQDSNDAVSGARGEIRRRRWDLSASVPADATVSNKLSGESHWIRTTTIRVRPGRAAEYEAQLKLNKAAHERANPGYPVFVSQSAAGQAIGVYYVTTLLKSLADLDKIKGLAEIRGAQGFAEYQKVVSETVIGADIMIGHFLPELSNPPEGVAAADPKFWRPKPAAAAAPKPAAEKK
jgi:hypothetical protein